MGLLGELSRSFHTPETTLASIAEHAIQSNLGPEPRSGRQEWCENLINQF